MKDISELIRFYVKVFFLVLKLHFWEYSKVLKVGISLRKLDVCSNLGLLWNLIYFFYILRVKKVFWALSKLEMFKNRWVCMTAPSPSTTKLYHFGIFFAQFSMCVLVSWRDISVLHDCSISHKVKDQEIFIFCNKYHNFCRKILVNLTIQ